MRSEKEVQRAHDIITQLLLGPSVLSKAGLFQHRDKLITVADVLCWVLLHDHNDTFANVLEMIEGRLKDIGLEVEELPELIDPRKDAL